MKIKALAMTVLLLAGLTPAPVQAADPYARMLMGNAWCSIRPGPDGRHIRVVFHADGHYVLTGDHRGNQGHWKLKGRSLWMAEANKELQPVAFEFKKQRRGRYILFVDGEEFARCR